MLGTKNHKTDALEKKCSELEAKISHLEQILGGYESALTNLRNNNAQIAALEQNVDTLNFKYKKLEKSGVKIAASSAQAPAEALNEHVLEAPVSSSGSSYMTIDYFDFENHFRGDKKLIKERQKQYLEYFEGCREVIDIGCGRGEFLELLKENQISAVGVDTYSEFVDYCKDNGLAVVCDDGNHYLRQINHTDGIFVGQVVEHMTPEQIVELCQLAYDKLENGRAIVIETPNPTSLAIYTHAFYMDPSHVKPVHPLTMKYFLEKAGFRDISIVYTQCSRLDAEIPALQCDNAENLDAFNQAMHLVSDTLFGSQDYAIIARR